MHAHFRWPAGTPSPRGCSTPTAPPLSACRAMQLGAASSSGGPLELCLYGCLPTNGCQTVPACLEASSRAAPRSTARWAGSGAGRQVPWCWTGLYITQAAFGVAGYRAMLARCLPAAPGCWMGWALPSACLLWTFWAPGCQVGSPERSGPQRGISCVAGFSAGQGGGGRPSTSGGLRTSSEEHGSRVPCEAAI